MDARLQRRVQRYGWDLAAPRYAPLWQQQLAPAQAALLAMAELGPGERVLDVACGTGIVSRAAARAVTAKGHVLGTDLSGGMVEEAARHTAPSGAAQPQYMRMDAEAMALSDNSFDAALCALGLMYMPDPAQALREMRRVLRAGGRMVAAVWGERQHCGWADVFSIVDAEVASEVCPLFFGLGGEGALARECRAAGLERMTELRIPAVLHYTSVDEACEAAFSGGPVAMAWSRFDDATRRRVSERYGAAIAPWRNGQGYAVPGEFVVARGWKPVDSPAG